MERKKEGPGKNRCDMGINMLTGIHWDDKTEVFVICTLMILDPCEFRAHGCLLGYEVPASLDGLGPQREQRDSHVKQPIHHQCAHGKPPASVEGEGLL